MSDLTHLDDAGHARMVDVAEREVTTRTATASGRVTTSAAALIRAGDVPKGDVLAVARIAGIMATKRTPDLIPLCHPLPITRVAVEFELDATTHSVHCTAQVETLGRTGVEMEALTAVQIGLLTIYDMCKSADRSMVIGDVALWEKTGGRSGAYRRPPRNDEGGSET